MGSFIIRSINRSISIWNSRRFGNIRVTFASRRHDRLRRESSPRTVPTGSDNKPATILDFKSRVGFLARPAITGSLYVTWTSHPADADSGKRALLGRGPGTIPGQQSEFSL